MNLTSFSFINFVTSAGVILVVPPQEQGLYGISNRNNPINNNKNHANKKIHEIWLF
jgi:hypothetical protein